MLEECFPALNRPFMGIVYGVIGSIAFTGADFLTQILLLSTKKFSVFELIWVSSVENIVLLAPFLFIFKVKIMFSADKWPMLFAFSVIGIMVSITIYSSLIFISEAAMLSLASIAPIFTIIFSKFILKEKCLWLDGVCTILGSIGVLLIARPVVIFGSFGKKEKVFYKDVTGTQYEILYLTGCGLAIASCLLRALYIVYARKWKLENPEASSIVPNLYLMLFCSLVCPPIMLLKGDVLVFPKPLYARCALFATAILKLIALQSLTLAAVLQNATISLIIRNLDIVWGFLLQAALLNVYASLWDVIGSIVVILSTVLISFRSRLLKTQTE